MKSNAPFLGIIFFAVVLMSNSTTSRFDMTAPAHPAAERNFQFNYAGEVFPGEGIMPLVGQLSKDGNEMFFTSQDGKGKKHLYKMARKEAGRDFEKASRVSGDFNDGTYDIIMPSVSADKKTIVFVHSANGMQKGNDLYVATLDEATGGYTAVKPLKEVNDPNLSDSYPWLSADGNRIYFTKQYGADIKFYLSERKDNGDVFRKPVELGFSLPAVSNNMSCMLSNDETELYALSGNLIYYAKRNSVNEPFGKPVEIANTSNSGYLSGITMTDDAKELFVYNSVGFRNTQILRFVNSETSNNKPVLSVPVGQK